MVAIPQQGELRGLRLAELLLDLERAAFGGTLQLVRGRMTKSLLFCEGELVYAESNLASESLGIQLLDLGLLDRAQHLAVSNHMQSQGCKEGAALLELGLMDARGLFAALKGQVRSRILECFSWRHGSFHVDPEILPPPDAQPFRARVPQLVQEGLERNWSAERIRAGLAAGPDLAVRSTSRLAAVQPQLPVDSEVLRFLAAAESGANMGRLLQGVSSPRALAAIWVMFRSEALLAETAQSFVSTPTPVPPRQSFPETPRASGEPAAQSTDEDAGEFQSAIQRTFESLSEVDHYRLLGVSQDASAEEIRGAYLNAATRFHPDSLVRAGLDANTREQASKIFAAMGKARSDLSDPARRREYDLLLDEDSGAELEGERALAAETSFRKGQILMQQGNFRAAAAFFEASVSLCPEEAAYVGELGWALFKQNPPNLPLARKHLAHACDLDPEDADLSRRLDQLEGETEAANARSD